ASSLGGAVLRGRGDDAAVGRPVKVMVRPERLRFLAEGETGMNRVRGRVSEVIFTGGVTKYFIGVESGAVLTMTTLTSPVEKPAREGDMVTVGWDAASTVVLPQGST